MLFLIKIKIFTFFFFFVGKINQYKNNYPKPCGLHLDSPRTPKNHNLKEVKSLNNLEAFNHSLDYFHRIYILKWKTRHLTLVSSTFLPFWIHTYLENYSPSFFYFQLLFSEISLFTLICGRKTLIWIFLLLLSLFLVIGN